MVVALGTGDVRAEEHREGVGKVVERHARVTEEITCRTVVPDFAIGSDHLIGDLVPRLVFGDLLLQPLGVWEAAHEVCSVELVLDAEHVSEVIICGADVAIGIEKLVDQLSTLGRAAALEEGRGFVVAGDTAHDVEINTTDELLVGAFRIFDERLVRLRLLAGLRFFSGCLLVFFSHLEIATLQSHLYQLINFGCSLCRRGIRRHLCQNVCIVSGLQGLRQGLIFR